MGFFTTDSDGKAYKDGDKWSDSGYTLKTEAMWPPDRMEMEYDKNKQGWLLDFSLSICKDEIAIKSQRSEDVYVFFMVKRKSRSSVLDMFILKCQVSGDDI